MDIERNVITLRKTSAALIKVSEAINKLVPDEVGYAFTEKNNLLIKEAREILLNTAIKLSEILELCNGPNTTNDK